jgi:hypothetical protein
MGGMQTLQWGVSYPDFMDSLVALVPLARTPSWTVTVLDHAPLRRDRGGVGQEHYRVLDGDRRVGRIYKAGNHRWFWGLGYEVTDRQIRPTVMSRRARPPWRSSKRPIFA